MKKWHLWIFAVCLVVLPRIVEAQNNIGFKYFGLSIHPAGEPENASLMPHKLDSKAVLVLNLGAEISYEHFIYDEAVSLKMVQAGYADCAARLGGFSHLGFRLKIVDSKNHSLYGGIGPTLVYRRNWLEMEDYVNLHRFKGGVDDRWQYLFLWYGGEIEYKYKRSKQWDFAISFVPGYPDLMSLALGMHYKFLK